MAGNQEVRLRQLIAGARLDAAIDAELDQWKNAKERLHEVGTALIAVSTPVSENLGPETVKSALESFKAVGQKVNDRADDIAAIHQALTHAVTVTRAAQTVVSDLDADQRDKPEFPPSKPGDDEADEMHNLKVYSGQMNVYNGWTDARETKAQQHADQVETAWQDAIAVMEKIPDDQTGGAGPAGGGSTGTGPIVPTSGTAPPTPVAPTTPTVPTDVIWQPQPPHHPTTPTIPTETTLPTPPTATPPSTHAPGPAPVSPGGGFTPPAHAHPGHVGPGPGLDPYGPGTPGVPGGVPGAPGAPVPAGDLAPTSGISPGSLSGMAVGGVAGAGILGGMQAGLRAAGVTGATAGLRSGAVLGASTRGAGSARGSLGAAGTRGTSAAGGSAAGRGTGSRGSRGVAGRRGAGASGAGGSGRGKDKDKKQRQPPVVELFDDDSDWVDDEGASSGVID